MSDARRLVLALLVSLCLHSGIASVLRALGPGRPTDDPGALPLYVDLVEPVVVVSDTLARPALRLAPAPARAPLPARPPERTATRSATEAEREAPPVSSEAAAVPSPPALVLAAPPAPPAAPVAPPPAPRASPARVPDVDLGSPRPVRPAPARPVVDEPARGPAPGPARPADPVIAGSAVAPLAASPEVERGPATRPETPRPAGEEGTRADGLGQGRESGRGGAEAGLVVPGSAALGPRAGTVGPEAGTIRPGASAIARGAGTADAGAGHGGAGGGREDAPTAGRGRTGGEVASLPGGRAGAIPPEYEGYVRRLRQRIQERLVYPWLAVRRGLSGVIELEVRLDAGGRLLSVDVAGPEGPRILRDAAAQAVREATPFPFPSGLTPRPLTIRLPVVFELK